ncbi:MAG: uroporphyrinogen decarboxylase family protein [Candidatus Syntropharchaeia archaeon]
MNSYERMMLILEGKKEEVDRIPCACPCVGTYTLDFMEKYDAHWPEAHKDPEKMARLGSAAHRETGLESVMVPFDVIVEAEILGMAPDFREKQIKKGKLLWPGVFRQGYRADGVKIETPDDLIIPDDPANAGRVPVITKALEILHEEFYGKVPVCTRVMGPLTTLGGYVLDTVQFYMNLATKPEEVKDFYERVKPLTIELVKIYFEAGADMVAVAEDAASCDNLSPEHFENLVKPQLKDIISKSGANVMSMSGQATPIIKACAETGTKMIVLDEKTDIVKAREITDSLKPEYSMALAGNLPTMGLLKKGPVEKIKEYVKNLIETAKIDVVSPGQDFWVKTPTENIRAMVEATIEYGAVK